MNKCISCEQETSNIICEQCEDINIIENLCDSLINYPYGKITTRLEEISSQLKQSQNIRLALFALADYFSGDKKIYYKLMSLSNGVRVNMNCCEQFVLMTLEILNSNELSQGSKSKLRAFLLNAYQSQYNYKECESLAKTMEREENPSWNTCYSLGEYYTFTRRYDKAIEILEKGITLNYNEKVNNLLKDKLTNCREREIGKKRAYMPASRESKEIYKDFMDKLGIETNVTKSKNPLEIPKEEYPDLVETRNTAFSSFVSVDLETTGFARYDEIIEIGAVRVEDGKIVDKFSSLVSTSRKLSEKIVQITGITDDMLLGAPELKEVIKKFMDFTGDEVLLGYNVIKFDSKFLMRAARKNGIVIKNPFFDVRKYALEINDKNNIFDKNDLNSICEKLRIINKEAHRALSDAEATAEVYLELLKIENKDTNKNDTLDDILLDMDDWL